MTLTTRTGRTCGGRRWRARWLLDPSGRHRRGYPPPESSRPEPEDFELCLALLDEAIGRAERWYACRERELAELDLGATEIVRGLRHAGIVRPSMTWNGS